MQNNLKENISLIKEKFGDSQELIVKEISSENNTCAILYILGITDTEALSRFVIQPILDSTIKLTPKNTPSRIPMSETESEVSIDKVISALIKGKGVLIFENNPEVIILGIDKFKERSLSEPPTSTVLKGPREGFVESLKTNISILRKILATPKLRNISTEVGKYTNTTVSIVYIDGLADKNVIENVKNKINSIKIDGVIDSHYITQYLEEHKNSMFKQVGNSEKPDIIAAKLLEGRIAIIVDGSPIVLTIPFIYLEDIQSSDDYYSNNKRASFIRWIRIFSIFISILSPGLYIAVVLHHYKAIPLKFLITIINTTKGLPLTPFAEIIFVLLLFEILYEASLRMPKYLGMALSIVGALILGDTAVKAGLISPPSVMIVAISGLSIYCVPDQGPQLYLLRILFTFAGGALGIFGITALMIFLLIYLCDFDSYGAAYFAPIAPLVPDDLNDSVIRSNLVNMKTRPKSFNKKVKNKIRQGKNINGKKDLD